MSILLNFEGDSESSITFLYFRISITFSYVNSKNLISCMILVR